MPELTPDVERELAALDDALAGRRVPPDLTELGELALALREQRPRPSPAFGAELDEKVRRGFRDPGPRRRASGQRWWHGLLTVPAFGLAFAVLLVVVVVATGPGGGSDDEGGGGTATSESFDGGGGAAEGSASSAEEAAGGARSAQEPAGDTATAGGLPPYPGPGTPRADRRQRRSVERSASLTLAARPRDIDAVSARVQDVTRQQGGFVVSATVSSSTSGGGGGQFELRVPTRNLDAAVAALSRLGSVRERSQRAQDITLERVSARSRLTDALTERRSLLRQLAAAVTPTETESIRRRLDIVAGEIERARAALRRVRNRATFSTVTVTLIADRNAGAPGTAPDDEWTPGDAARDALRVLEVAAGVTLIALAAALPLALLGAAAALAARWTRRRRREQALDAV
jgi:hypothetical protein